MFKIYILISHKNTFLYHIDYVYEMGKIQINKLLYLWNNIRYVLFSFKLFFIYLNLININNFIVYEWWWY